MFYKELHFITVKDYFMKGYNLVRKIISKLAGATRPCPGHYIKIIKCTVRAKVARYVSPKVCYVGSVYLQFLPLDMQA